MRGSLQSLAARGCRGIGCLLIAGSASGHARQPSVPGGAGRARGCRGIGCLLIAGRRSGIRGFELGKGPGLPPSQTSLLGVGWREGRKIMSTSSHKRKPRFDVSLARLTRRFMELVSKAPDGVLDINDVAWMLGVRKRRVYDITNVLDGIHLVRKKSKNLIEWIGKNPQERLGYEAQSRKLRKELADLTTVENSLDELIKDCAQQLYSLTEDKENARLAYVTYKDIHGLQAFKEQIVIAIKAPQETKLEVPIPNEEKIQVYIKSTEGPIDVFVCEMQEEYCPPKTCEDDTSNGNEAISSTDEAVTLPPDRDS
ncbi:transcription factor E2F6-like isoform X2 [Hypanus sabinus]|uniref:transcription factor E2F6-like isoform X2 n=1 Tax=Hypanus sabinus TaxID=79690 RepID=UPI0028C44BE3|nr:transcription factor E2F6-like isoform X2 [Hypanus sabinus]XP_059837899.1 transcription factor E2F6-like isoform X2 [Hypanus sabinus]XP_059837900.1 transcription factor E2F6-like isoform X2 [Hypanus sabinus]XP_059837902.1 transcription factor E2F6-like isoform X2 [Hypanus sabinus]